MNPETHSCDCGYTWRHGHSGTHLCGPQYRATIERQAQEIAALKAQQADRITKDASQLTTQELSDPEYMKAYIEGCNESFAEAMREIVRLRVELFEASQLDIQDQEATPEADAEQLARSKWTVKQWYEHVGAWENAQGEVCFGSVMALGAMLKLMARARNSVAPITMPNDGLAPPQCRWEICLA